MGIIKVLSLREPWLYAMWELGKDIENRVWSTTHRGELYLHRAVGLTRSEYDWAEAWMQDNIDEEIILPPFDRFVATRRFGGIMGLCTVTGCTLNSKRAHRPPWAMLTNRDGRPQYGFDVQNLIGLRFVPWVGMQRIFNVDRDAYDAARERERIKWCERDHAVDVPSTYVFGGIPLCDECTDVAVTSEHAHPSEIVTVAEFESYTRKVAAGEGEEAGKP